MARVALILAAALVLFEMLASTPDFEIAPVPWSKAPHFLAFYGLTALGFLSFPKTRRTDILQLVILSAVALEVGRSLLGRPTDVFDLFADVAGALTIFFTSFSEQMRKRARDFPDGPAISRGRRRSRASDARSARAKRAEPAPSGPSTPPPTRLAITHTPSPPR